MRFKSGSAGDCFSFRIRGPGVPDGAGLTPLAHTASGFWSLRPSSPLYMSAIWRNASEEEPDKYGEYLVAVSCGVVYVDEWVPRDREWRGEVDPLTHWMPLPEGPEG